MLSQTAIRSATTFIIHRSRWRLVESPCNLLETLQQMGRDVVPLSACYRSKIRILEVACLTRWSPNPCHLKIHSFLQGTFVNRRTDPRCQNELSSWHSSGYLLFSAKRSGMLLFYWPVYVYVSPIGPPLCYRSNRI